MRLTIENASNDVLSNYRCHPVVVSLIKRYLCVKYAEPNSEKE